MIAGRDWGHTGQEVEATPGFRTGSSLKEARSQIEIGLRNAGRSRSCAGGQEAYVLRDVTGTVDPFLCSPLSIMSKKLAEGLNGWC